MNHDKSENDNIDITEDINAQAKQIAGLLDTHAMRLSMRTLKQLENGRARAVQAHSQQLSGTHANSDGSLSSFGGIFGWAAQHRLTSTALILGAFITGFVLMQTLSQAPSDAFLLSADLPPEAFVDRGFEPSLNSAKL